MGTGCGQNTRPRPLCGFQPWVALRSQTPSSRCSDAPQIPTAKCPVSSSFVWSTRLWTFQEFPKPRFTSSSRAGRLHTMLAANKNAKVWDEANEPALHILSMTALSPAAPSPSGARLRPGWEAQESGGCPRTECRLPDICSPGEQVWVHVLMLSPTSYTWGGAPARHLGTGINNRVE